MTLAVYLPEDRRQALARGEMLPNRMTGTALFADLSGFTALTEALALALGPRRGAEALTYQLNTTYDPLIATVDRYGGSVIGFAGDAITCWFDDVDGRAAMRGAACALALQDTMRRFESVPLPNGASTAMALKVAVASGPARRLVVGDPAVQVIDTLAGTTIARMATGEHLAAKGEVLIDETTYALLGDRAAIAAWRADHVTHDRFAVLTELSVRVEPQPWPNIADALLPDEAIRPWLLPAIYERQGTGLGDFLTELRPAIALFLRFDGIDYALDPDAGTKFDSFIRRVQAILARYEGTLLQLTIGDKGSYLYAAFGAPVAHEDDARRAGRVALEWLALPHELDFLTALQVGISRGVMRAGAYGGTTRRTYGVLGDAVNLAARLMGQAAPGEILISGRVQSALGPDFALEPRPPIRLKGMREPLPVFAIIGPSRRRAIRLEEPAYTLPMVGRAAELAHITEKLNLALHDHGQIVAITADAGMGKSRLVAEVIRLARRRNVMCYGGACQSYAMNTSYLAWVTIWRAFFDADPAASLRKQIRTLESAVEDLAPDRVEALPLLGSMLQLPLQDNDFTRTLEPQYRQSALHALLLSCLRAAAREAAAAGAGMLIVVEDLHWIDPASHNLLEFLAREIADLPVMIVLTYRPQERVRMHMAQLEALPHFSNIKLGELVAADVEQVIRAKLAQLFPERSGMVPASLIERVTERAQGNPFYVEELLNYLHDRGIDPRDEAALQALELPDSLHRLILSRIDGLSARQQTTLKVASIIGRLFQFAWLHGYYPALGEAEGLKADLNELAALDLTPIATSEPELTYLFKHIVTREVTYESMAAATQATLHAQLGAYLEAQAAGDAGRFLDLLTYHYRRSGVLEKALFYLDRAARKAQREYANETALGYYQEALALEERWQWRQGQVEVLHILGRREEEQSALRALEASPGAPAFTVAYLWGQHYEVVGDYSAARAAIERALAAARAHGDTLGELRCLSQLGLVARRQGDYEHAKAYYGEALALFGEEAPRSDEEARALAQALNGLGIVQRQQGQFDQARVSYERAMAVSILSGDRRGEAEALNGIGVAAYYQRQFAEALPYHQQALEIRRAIGDRAGEGTSLLNLAQAIRDAGDYGEAERCFLEALAIQQMTGNRWEEVNIWNDLGILYQELGDLAQARTCLERGLALTRSINDEAGQAYLLSNLGLVVRDDGDMEAAASILTDGLHLAQTHADRNLTATFLSYLSSIDLRMGRFDRAMQHGHAALDMRRQLDMWLRTTADLTTLAAASLGAGDLNSALSYARDALAILDESAGEGPECPQQDYFMCFQVFTALGQSEVAQSALLSAYGLVMARTQKIIDPLLRQSFLERVLINRQIMEEARRVLGVTSAG
jgi:adenylate cyclase